MYIVIVACHKEVTTIAPVAILALKSYTQEATNSEQSDIRVIRSTEGFTVHTEFVQSCRNSAFRIGNSLSLLRRYRARYGLLAAAHVTARTQ